MNCPTCPDTTLVMTDRQGVEIDYCPKCRGVWLDRGELDKLIARSGEASAPSAKEVSRNPAHTGFSDSGYGHDKGYPRKRPKSWLSEIFD